MKLISPKEEEELRPKPKPPRSLQPQCNRAKAVLLLLLLPALLLCLYLMVVRGLCHVLLHINFLFGSMLVNIACLVLQFLRLDDQLTLYLVNCGNLLLLRADHLLEPLVLLHSPLLRMLFLVAIDPHQLYLDPTYTCRRTS